MGAAVKNITIERGSSLSLHFFVQNTADQSPFDLTGYTIAGQVRETPNAKHTLAILVCQIVAPATNGEITITLDDTSSAAIEAGVYHWDLVIRYPGQSIRLLAGKATVVDTVSR